MHNILCAVEFFSGLALFDHLIIIFFKRSAILSNFILFYFFKSSFPNYVSIMNEINYFEKCVTITYDSNTPFGNYF
jgi:hypothetical protein